MGRSRACSVVVVSLLATVVLSAGPVAAAPGEQRWISTYGDPAGRFDGATALAVDSEGGRIYATGESRTGDTALDFATVAYDAETGRQLWVARYDGPLHHRDRATAIVVAPQGGAVFVTGSSGQRLDDSDWATAAYDAASGEELWSRRMDLGTTGHDYARDLSFHAGRVFVTGENGDDGLTVAYDADTGDVVWRARITRRVGADASDVEAFGRRVFVAGLRYTRRGSNVLAQALRADTGETIWTRVYAGVPGGTDQTGDAAISPDGKRWYVAATVEVERDVFQATTIAFRASSGESIWTRTIGTGAAGVQGVPVIATSADGRRVAVATTGELQTSSGVFVTRLYGSSGRTRWTSIDNDVGQTGSPRGVVFTPEGGVVVAGVGSDVSTQSPGAIVKAYGPSTGSIEWTAFELPARRGGGFRSIGIAPDGSVCVTGEIDRDYLTATYLSA